MSGFFSNGQRSDCSHCLVLKNWDLKSPPVHLPHLPTIVPLLPKDHCCCSSTPSILCLCGQGTPVGRLQPLCGSHAKLCISQYHLPLLCCKHQISTLPGRGQGDHAQNHPAELSLGGDVATPPSLQQGLSMLLRPLPHPLFSLFLSPGLPTTYSFSLPGFSEPQGFLCSTWHPTYAC